MTQNPEVDEQFVILEIRLGQFLNIWTVIQDYMSGKYVPSFEMKPIDPDDYRSPAAFPWTFTSLLYSFFFSLVDTHTKGLNAFRIWRSKFPDQLAAINAVEFRVNEILPELKNYRNKLGFHGSQSIDEEDIGYELLERHGIVKVLNVIQFFISLAICFLTLDRSNDFNEINDAKERISVVEQFCRVDSGCSFQNENLLLNWLK